MTRPRLLAAVLAAAIAAGSTVAAACELLCAADCVSARPPRRRAPVATSRFRRDREDARTGTRPGSPFSTADRLLRSPGRQRYSTPCRFCGRRSGGWAGFHSARARTSPSPLLLLSSFGSSLSASLAHARPSSRAGLPSTSEESMRVRFVFAILFLTAASRVFAQAPPEHVHEHEHPAAADQPARRARRSTPTR
jgi:hypothetical protein